MLHCPQESAKPHSICALHLLEINAFGTESEAKSAQRDSIWRFKSPKLMGDIVSRYASEFAYELKDEPPPDTAERQGLRREERCQPTLDLNAQKGLQTLSYPFACLRLNKVAGYWIYARGEHPVPCHQSPDGATAPAQHSAGVDGENLIRIRREAPDAGGNFLPKHAACGGNQHPRLGTVNRIGQETQSVQSADIGPLDKDLSHVRNRGQQFGFGCKLADQQSRSPIDETLRDAVVQCIRESILDTAGALLPRGRVIDPVTAMGDVGPGTNVRDARHQRVDVAVDAIEICHLSRDPTRWKSLLEASQMTKAMTK
jgi:hypothetical protein